MEKSKLPRRCDKKHEAKGYRILALGMLLSLLFFIFLYTLR